MNLRTEILKENSKANSIRITSWIGDDRKKFDQLVQLFLNDEYRVVQRAAGMISRIAEQHPNLLQPYLTQLIKKANETNIPVAVKRNVVRLMQFIDIPTDVQGDTMELCFKLLSDPAETVAVHCFSMSVLFNLSKIYPDIKPELKIVIEEHMQHPVTAGFLSRAKKVLAKIRLF